MKKKIDEQLEALQKQVEEWKDKYLRALADYQNLEKRTHEERAQSRRHAAVDLVKRLLPIVDTFERAEEHLNDPGLALALKELYAFLDAQGVKKFDAVGRDFNPEEMECIEVVEGEDNIVVEELLPGYALHGKVIRVAQVKVGRTEKSTNDQFRNKQMNDTINQ